jgi:hypothetical protein
MGALEMGHKTKWHFFRKYPNNPESISVIYRDHPLK